MNKGRHFVRNTECHNRCGIFHNDQGKDFDTLRGTRLVNWDASEKHFIPDQPYLICI